MMDLKEAYQILGLPEDAAIDEVEKKYELFLRKGKSAPESVQISRINQAYRMIKDHEYNMAIQESNKGKSPRQEAWEHFWYHYKGYVIGGIITAVLVGLIVYSIVDRVREQNELADLPPAALDVMIYGDFAYPNLVQLENRLLGAGPSDWERVRVVFSFFPLEASDPYAIAAQQKSVLELLSARPDLFLSDADNFERLYKQGAFQPLNEEWEQALVSAFGRDNLIYRKNAEGQERLYGIIVTESPLLERIFVEEDKTILLSMGVEAANLENVSLILQQFVQ